MRRLDRLSLVCLILLSAVPSTKALAQEEVAGAPPGAAPAPTDAPKKPVKLDKATLDEARRAYKAGELSYQAGDYKSAVLNFKDAQSRVPSPHAAYWLAMAYKEDGQVPEAIAQFESFLSDPAASKVGEEKLSGARAALEALRKTPGTLTLDTKPQGAVVAVDTEVRPGATPLAVEMTPGVHTLTVSLTGYATIEVQMEMPPGSKGEQVLELEKLPPPPAPPVASSPEKVASKPALPPPVVLLPRSPVPAYVLFGLAGAGTITGAVFGALALGDKGRFNDHPTNANADAAERDALGADIAFAAAITFGLAGVAYLVAPRAEGRPRPSEGGVASTTPRLRPFATSHATGANAQWLF